MTTTTEDIRQSLEVAEEEIKERQKELASESQRIRKAIEILSPARRKPGRPPKVSK